MSCVRLLGHHSVLYTRRVRIGYVVVGILMKRNEDHLDIVVVATLSLKEWILVSGRPANWDSV